MKITLDIDPSVLGTEVSEFIKTLTTEDKNALVKQVVNEYYVDYRKFEVGERQLKEQEIIDRLLQNADDYDRRNYIGDGKDLEKIKRWHKFQEEAKKIKTFAQSTREEISSAIRLQLTSQIAEFTKNDETYQNLLREAMDNVKERFPLMVQAAMIAHMANQLPNLQSQIYEMTGNIASRLNDVEQKLLR